MDGATYYLIFFNYFLIFLGGLVSIYFMFRIYQYFCQKRDLFDVLFDKKHANSMAKKWMKKYKRRYNFGTLLLMIIWIFCTAVVMKNNLPYLFNVLLGQYETVECISIMDSQRAPMSHGSNRFSMTCENEKRIEFTYYGDYIEKGTRIKVNYFKGINIGKIISIEEKDTN